MNSTRKIIAATDFSPPAINATKSAVQLAKRLGDTLVLARVVQPPSFLYPELAAGGLESIESALITSAESQLKAAAAALRAEGIAVETKVLVGDPGHSLTTLAREEDARMMVMGTHGRRAAARFVLGSLAERIILAAPCPVLVMRDGANPFESWTRGTRPLQVVAGVDFTASSDPALNWIRELRALGPCAVLLVHSYWPPREYTRLGLPAPADLSGTDPEIAAVLERELRARIGDLAGGQEVRLQVHAAWGRTAESLAECAEIARADLLLVGTHQPHGWERLRAGSTAVTTVRTTTLPVLCVPRAAAAKIQASATAATPAIRSVLAATDFSNAGNAAIPFAYSLLRGSGGVVELCYVHERFVPSSIYSYESDSNKLNPKARAEFENRLRDLVPADAEKLGITTHILVIDGGVPDEALTQAAERLGAGAICLSSHGRSGIGKALMGSVAQAVVHRATRPVVVVR